MFTIFVKNRKKLALVEYTISHINGRTYVKRIGKQDPEADIWAQKE